MIWTPSFSGQENVSDAAAHLNSRACEHAHLYKHTQDGTVSWKEPWGAHRMTWLTTV